jgi:hypothetical protein
MKMFRGSVPGDNRVDNLGYPVGGPTNDQVTRLSDNSLLSYIEDLNRQKLPKNAKALLAIGIAKSKAEAELTRRGIER